MTIPPEINSIVESLNQELEEIELIAKVGQNLARDRLCRVGKKSPE